MPSQVAAGLSRRSVLGCLPGLAGLVAGLPLLRPAAGARLPERVVGAYWVWWGDPVRLDGIPPAYNTIFLFHATPVGGAPGTTGAVEWNRPGNGRGAADTLVEDLARLRAGRSVLLTVGGADAGLDLSTRDRARAFVRSVVGIYDELGGFDGLDWNTYEGGQTPHVENMIWASLELRRLLGQDFAITTPPGPTRPTHLELCRAMVAADALDLASPQYYGGGTTYTDDEIADLTDTWVAALGDAGKVGVGLALPRGGDAPTTHPATTWERCTARHPGLRGAYGWNVVADEEQGWAFAEDVSRAVVPTSPLLPPRAPWCP